MDNKRELVFKRSNRGTLNKYEEALKIIEYSVMLVKLFKVKEFNNVIAGQLRLILCDTSKQKGKIIDNSLIKKINLSPKLFPVKEFVIFNEKGDAFIPDDLFDYTQPKIPLKEWLDQPIMRITLDKLQHKITIFDFIKESANKSGGAHVDSKLPEKSFIVDVHFERVLCGIAEGLFRSIGRKLFDNSVKNLNYLIETYKEIVSE